MNQPSLFETPLSREFVIRKAGDWCYEIPQKVAGKPFAEWLDTNWHVWERFSAIANEVWARGRKHYSARTILEVMRHETVIREIGSDFKLNDQSAPPMARLYMHLWPEKTGFFELRDQDRKEAA